MCSSVTSSNKAIARMLADVFGGRGRVVRFHDDSGAHHVDVLDVIGSPQAAVQSCGTIGLSDSPVRGPDSEDVVPFEIVGACAAEFAEFGNVIASCAFEILKTKRYAAPGVIFPEIFGRCRPSSEMRNVLLLPPFLWEGLHTLKLQDKTVAWLMVVPVSDAEMRFAIRNGPAALEDIFNREQIDVFDPDRRSVA